MANEVLDYKASARGGSQSLEGTSFLGLRGLEMRVNFRDVYVVLAGSDDENEDTILATTGIPQLYSYLRGGFCKRRTAKEIETFARHWEVEVEYDSTIDPNMADQSSGGGAGGTPSAPESLLPEWYWDADEYEEVIATDQQDGSTIQNAVGEKIIVTRPVKIPTLVIARFETSFVPSIILNYANHVNSADFWGAPAQCVLLKGVRDQPQTIGGVRYRRVEYHFAFNFKKNKLAETIGWKWYGLHEGTQYKEYVPEGDRTRLVPFKDAHGHRTKGNLRADGFLPTSDDEISFLKFNRFPAVDFNSLTLGPW